MEITFSAVFPFLEMIQFPEWVFGPVVEQTEPIKETKQITGSTAGANPSIIGGFGGVQTIQ